MNLQITEIADLNDDLLIPWLDLYETAFPPTERMLVSFYLRLLREKREGMHPDHHLLAVQRESVFVGLAHYVVIAEQKLVWLWMFAVTPEARNHGIGAAMYEEIVRRLPDWTIAILIEVERPDLAQTEAERELAERRIAFYRRQGALLLEGVHYVQSVGPHQPPLPMHVMVHPLVPLDAETAFRLACAVFGDSAGGESITQIGSLAFC
ncbi:MAG: GNAT family N-acetyltransferase [Anaerolineae bacterium]|nr:GNAT family N-acetyltransferase [Anaerolineae bacterium]